MEQVHDVVEVVVADRPGLFVQGHQPGGVPGLHRGLGDELLGQVVGEIFCF